ncbi:unnamed protein product, partial [Pleuronectes platessa]
MQQAAFTRGLIEESNGNWAKVSTRLYMLQAISEEQHEQGTPPPMCTLHWDSKLTPMLTDNWDLVPHKDSRPLSCFIPDEVEPPFLGKFLRAELIAFTAGVLDYKRGDYSEFVQLCLVYLGAD